MPTVVIADDSPLLRRIVTSVLTSGGFDVVAAEDGVSAVAAVYRSVPDAVVLDAALPRVSGQVVTRLRKADWRTRTIPIVLASPHDAAGGRFWAAHAGADRCLTRDFEPAELTATVRELIEAARAGQDPRRTSTTRSMRPRPVELADEEVLARACELLDRHLFETSVAAEVTLLGTTSGFELTIAGLLRLLARFVDHDLAAVLLPGTRTAYVSIANVATRDHYGEFVTAAAGTLTSSEAPNLPRRTSTPG